MSSKNGRVGMILEKYQHEMTDIMPNIRSVLEYHGYEIQSNKKETEFVIVSEEIDDIQKLIYKNIDLPELVINVLITIKRSKGKVYIRQRVK